MSMKLSQNMAKYYVLHHCTSNQFTTPWPRETQRTGNVLAPYRDSCWFSWGFIITNQFTEINKVNHAFNMSEGVRIFRAYGIICLRRPDSSS